MFTSKPVAVSPCAPIVTKIPELMAFAPLRGRFAVEGIAAEWAAGQTLQKVPHSAQAQTRARAIFPQLLLRGAKQRLINDWRGGHEYPLLSINRGGRIAPARFR